MVDISLAVEERARIAHMQKLVDEARTAGTSDLTFDEVIERAQAKAPGKRPVDGPA